MGFACFLEGRTHAGNAGCNLIGVYDFSMTQALIDSHSGQNVVRRGMRGTGEPPTGRARGNIRLPGRDKLLMS
jgi:hypothetical protein